MTASIMVWAALIAVLLLIFFYISRPLTNEEVAALASIRRIKGIRAYYSFDNREYTANPSFKKMMNPNGQMYVVNDPLWKFPAIAAALLKGKKHEWIIIGFEKNKRIHKMWTNKGYNNSSVDILFSPEQLVDIAKEDDYCSVLIFHNHPNSNPNRYDCSMASNQDMSTARKFAKTLNAKGINLLEFICERGQHYEYYLSSANSFMPIESYLKNIRENNGVSRFNNLELQIELIFGKQQKTKSGVGTNNYGNKNGGNESAAIAILYGILAILLFLYPQSLLIIVPILFLLFKL